MSPHLARRTHLATLAAITLSTAGCLVDEDTDDADTNEGNGNGNGGSDDTSSDESDDTDESSDGEQRPQHGEVVSLDNLDITVLWTGLTPSLDRGFDVLHADGIFALVEVELENTGSESMDITSNQFQLGKQDGTSYDADSEAAVSFDEALSFDQLQPGIETEGFVIFDIPDDGSEWSLVVGEAGFLFTDEVSIYLGEIDYAD